MLLLSWTRLRRPSPAVWLLRRDREQTTASMLTASHSGHVDQVKRSERWRRITEGERKGEVHIRGGNPRLYNDLMLVVFDS